MDNAALNIALKYLSYRSRTVLEMKTYLQKKGYKKKTTAHVLEYLEKHNYVNDKLYCKLFLEYRSMYKPKSIFALKYELKLKGISSSLIDKMVSAYNDDELAMQAVERKIRHWQHFDNEKLNKKIMNYLQYRGFSYSVCISTLNKIKNCLKEENEN